MQINVSQLLQEPTGSARSYEIDDSITPGGSPVRGTVELLRTGRSILVRGKLQAEVGVTCSRCLGSFQCPLTLKIEEEYFPTTDVISGTALPFPEEPGAFTIDEHCVLDLTEAVCQYIALVTPMKPLCRPDCAGLCSRCGSNLNQGPCRCPSPAADPRWSELDKLDLEDNTQ